MNITDLKRASALAARLEGLKANIELHERQIVINDETFVTRSTMTPDEHAEMGITPKSNLYGIGSAALQQLIASDKDTIGSIVEQLSALGVEVEN